MTDKKTILVTGASRGIGILTVRTLAAQGHKVLAAMRAPETRNQESAAMLEACARDTGTDISVVEMDVTDEASVGRAVDRALADGPIDVLINNAGVMPVGVTEAFTVDQLQSFFDVNMFGIARTTRAVLPSMRQQGSGLLVHLSSAAGRLSIPYFGAYCATKWALEAYAESLHFELEGTGVESVLIEPSGHGTDLVKTAPAPKDAATDASYGDKAQGRDRLLGMFETEFEAGNPINDAQNVADRIAELVEMTGPRPIRTQVGADMGVAACNDATLPIQSALIEGLRPIYSGAAA